MSLFHAWASAQEGAERAIETVSLSPWPCSYPAHSQLEIIAKTYLARWQGA